MLALDGTDFWTPDELRARYGDRYVSQLETGAVAGSEQAGLTTAGGEPGPSVDYDSVRNSLETLTAVAAWHAYMARTGALPTSPIPTAEAARFIEDTKRVLNVAFVNDLAVIYDKLGLDSATVLQWADTR